MTYRRETQIHYLRRNHRTWSPPVLVSFDTETRWLYQGESEVHALRLWCARIQQRRTKAGKQPVAETANGYSGESFARQLDTWVRKHRCVWAYAHNLSFDLAVLDLVSAMEDLGWYIADFALDGAHPFVRLGRGDTRLTIADSHSWLPVPLNAIARALGMTKPELPVADDSDESWLVRCRADTDILHTAMSCLMDWWDDNELGNWTITGAASGWNAMRHTESVDRVLIRPDKGEVEFDRRAIYGGKRYCYRAGNVGSGLWSEVDLIKAYPTTCRDHVLPMERMVEFDSLPVDHSWISSQRHGIVAEVVIRTDVPDYPCRIDGLVWYPVGEFRTVLAGPDIKAARRRGHLVSIGHGWMHKLGRSLKPWAEWVISLQDDDSHNTPEIAKIAARHWGRAVTGKWAQRGFERLELGPAMVPGAHYEEAWDHYANVRASIIDFAGSRWQVTARAETDNAYPAILAWIESYVRVALNDAIHLIGSDNIVYCDTDGFLMRSLSEPALDLYAELQPAYRLRVKKRYDTVTVHGPQHMTLDGESRMAGISRSAVRQADGTLKARQWPNISWQIAHGAPGYYVRPTVRYTLAPSYVPGWITTTGQVVPVEIIGDGNGGQTIAPWSETRYYGTDVVPSPDQSMRLHRYDPSTASAAPCAKTG